MRHQFERQAYEMKAEMVLTVKHTGPHRTLYEKCVVEKLFYLRVTLDTHLPEEQYHTAIKSAEYLDHLYAKVCCSIAGHDHCHTKAELALTSTDVQPQPLQLDLL